MREIASLMAALLSLLMFVCLMRWEECMAVIPSASRFSCDGHQSQRTRNKYETLETRFVVLVAVTHEAVCRRAAGRSCSTTICVHR
jgi:hypothetical protein